MSFPSPSTPTPTPTSPHQTTHKTASLNPPKPQPLTTKFLEGPMLDEPSQPPASHHFTNAPSTQSISPTKATNPQVPKTTSKPPPRCASEPLDASSPKSTGLSNKTRREIASEAI
ncbi:hypothetical protein BHYA_0091g00410 [Botrytis hyacinthi]|uniref:Uncharacterized protein n=1 Tax=Botrytis hyacinthi TaxID=278943 RepID=A0A4Z1GWD6_9HELO|nr:hypothetical protein BHYA_0091g00410 [Botrytis hyacinthi]